MVPMGFSGKQVAAQRQEVRAQRQQSDSRNAKSTSKKSASTMLRILGVNAHKPQLGHSGVGDSKQGQVVTAANIDKQLLSLKQAQTKRKANQHQILDHASKQLSTANVEVLMGYQQDLSQDLNDNLSNAKTKGVTRDSYSR